MKTPSDHAKLSRLRDENRKLTKIIKTLTKERHEWAVLARQAQKDEQEWERRFDAVLRYLGEQTDPVAPELAHVWKHNELIGSTMQPWDYCSVCGVVKRRDGQNTPCRGKAPTLTLRATVGKDTSS